MWTDPDTGGLYLNPACPEAARYVVQGVAELVQNYPVDGIHFDDYFYPTTDPALAQAQFDQSGQGDRGAFRRQQVTALVQAEHDAVKAQAPTLRVGISPQGNPDNDLTQAVKAQDPTLRFGISPQGNPDNDLTQQYSDVYSWLAAEGEQAVLDYLCPQIYWGYGYMQRSGSTRFGFENIEQEWLAMPR